MSLKLEIVTPESCVHSDTCDSVVVPTVQGEIGILPGHIPLLTQVQAGELRVTKGDQVTHLVVGDGFAEIDGDRVSVLAEFAVNEEQIDPSVVEKAMQRAQELLVGREKLDPNEIERLEGVVRSSVVKLGVKRTRR